MPLPFQCLPHQHLCKWTTVLVCKDPAIQVWYHLISLSLYLHPDLWYTPAIPVQESSPRTLPTQSDIDPATSILGLHTFLSTDIKSDLHHLYHTHCGSYPSYIQAFKISHLLPYVVLIHSVNGNSQV